MKFNLIKSMFLLPCLPYYFVSSMWVITRVLENNHTNICTLFDLSESNLNENDKHNYNRAKSMLRPFEYGYSFVFWVYFIKYLIC